MPTVTYYDGPETSGKNLGFDNSPNSVYGESGPFTGVNWDNGEVLETSSLIKITVNQEGHTYTMSIIYDWWEETVTGLALGIDGNPIVTGTDFSIPLNDLLFYEGQALTELIYGGHDDIYGSSVSDIIWGYGGSDILYGLGGNDRLHGGGGYNLIFGGTGQDSALFDYDYADYALSRNPSNGRIEVIPKSGGSLGIIGSDVEKVSFRDSSISTSDLNYWGTYSSFNSNSQRPVYRFFQTRDNAFFYTANLQEANLIMAKSSVSNENIGEWSYVYQGSTFAAAFSYPNQVPLYRFYNTRTGHHFFTASENERDHVISQINSAGWTFEYEGVAYNVYLEDPTPGYVGNEVPVYRFFSPQLNRHFFTASETESAVIQNSDLWIAEGVGFYGEAL